MKPTGKPFVKGPTSNPPTQEEILQLVEKYDQKSITKETELFSSTFLFILGGLLVVLIIIILWKKKIKK